MRKPLLPLYTMIFMFLYSYAYPAVPVGILPFNGDQPQAKRFEERVKQVLLEDGVISVVADDMLKKIMEIQEKAQALGSTWHDISKLKVAQYIMYGSVTGFRAQITVADVNAGVEIFNKSCDDIRNDYQVKKLIREAKELIALRSYQTADIPSEAKPHMELAKNFVSSLEMGDVSSYPYLGFYRDGGYRHPAGGDKEMAEKAKDFIKIVKPNLIKAKLIFNGIDTKSPSIIYLRVIAEKMGKKTKIRFGVMEMDDGSLGITNCDQE